MALKFTHMVMSGGGLMGMVYIGALRYLYQERLIDDIKHIAGSSVGAIFATAVALDIPIDILEAKFKEQLKPDHHVTDVDINTLIHAYKKLGVNDGSEFVDVVREQCGKMTFLDLAKKSGKNLVICATHISTMQPTYFCVENTPNVLIVQALRASTAIPLLIIPVKIGDDYYIDGCVSHYLPIEGLPRNFPKQNTLILKLHKNIEKSERFDVENTNIIAYAEHLISAYISQNANTVSIIKMNYPYFVTFNKIPIQSIPIKINENACTMSSIGEQQIDDCFMVGYETMYEHVKEWRASATLALEATVASLDV